MRRNSYKGSRFYKCDLQMNTPADPAHWAGEKFKPGEEQKSAEEYISRCYEAGLEVIGITDHNFVSVEFIPYLQKAIEKLKEKHGYEILIFPGFEIEANIGKGLHALAIFEPNTKLVDIDHTLTECGVKMPRYNRSNVLEKSSKPLHEIISIVQDKSDQGLLKGLVICPHAQSTSGIFDNDSISEWLQQSEFTNDNLLCLEVPKSPEAMSNGWQSLLRNREDCQPGWRRKRQIACIMSSDCKKLRSESDSDSMYIGWRYCWIKMSHPSIEALRQAFLDPGSRIYLGKDDPNEHSQHLRIKSFGINNAAFLSDLKVDFSPNLNVVIGGRGTGKSTILEYLRFCLDQSDDVSGTESRENLKSLKKTLTKDTRIHIDLEKDGSNWKLECTGDAPPQIATGATVPSIKRFFPANVFSQREIYAIASDTNAVFKIIDAAIETELSALRKKESEIVTEIDLINRELQELPALEERSIELETDLKSVDLKLGNLKKHESLIAAWQARSIESTYVERLVESTKEISTIGEALSGFVKSIDEILPPSQLSNHLSDLLPDIQSITKSAQEEIMTILATTEKEFAAAINSESVSTWLTEIEIEQKAFDAAMAELDGNQANPQNVQQYLKDRDKIEAEKSETSRKIEAIKKRKKQRDGSILFGGESLIKKLHACWKEMASVRAGAAKAITALIPETKSGNRMVEVEVVAMGDLASWLARMRMEIKDKRKVSEEDWDSLMTAIFETAKSKGLAPAEILTGWTRDLNQGKQPVGCEWNPTEKRTTALLEWLTEEQLQNLRIHRIPERIEVRLFRQDGTLVGELFQGTLSVGQKCTAILALIFAKGTNPLIIDQPEDDLDGEFVYRELVPVIRQIKQRRQLIIATHNPNIPVNADAELILALDVSDGKGAIRKGINKEESIGTLDHCHVQVAIKEIMEGSDEAFRKRSEKYGF